MREPRLLAVALLLSIVALLPITAEDGPIILERVERVRSPEADYVVDFRLDVVDPASSWKERSAAYTMIAHDKDHSLVIMRQPDHFHPGTLLITSGRYWLVLPRSSKPFQLSPRHVLNGDIAYGDLARGNLLAHYEARLDGEEVVRDEPCYRLELARTHPLGLHKRIRAWVAKDGFLPQKFEYYGETGALLKTAYYEDYRKGPLGLRSMRIVVESALRPGEKSVLTFDRLRRFDSSRLSFDIESLTSIRDAFAELRAPDGTQAEAEEVLLRIGAAPP